MKHITYYEIAVALSAIWKDNVYTYDYTKPLRSGDVVLIPFGESIKTGYVVKSVNKPGFTTKTINQVIPGLTLPKTPRDMIDWLQQFYPNTPGLHVQHFLPTFIQKLPNTKKKERKLHIAIKQPPLTKGQRESILELSKNTKKPSILHGITGSGKTRVYSELAQQYLDSGKNVLVIYPEISLTSQLEQSLTEYFSNREVSIFHSKRTPGQQQEAWIAVYNAKKGHITIGPRSALFLPHQNLGLVIVDEAHDGAYKESNGSRYNGVTVSAALAKKHNAKLILGSATPPVKETFQVTSKGGTIVCMHDLAISSKVSSRNFTMVDMTDKTNHHPSSYLLSKILINTLKASIVSKKQSLLFLNRRGTARMLICRNCGWQAQCDRCDMPLAYHHDSYILQCHVCGLKQKMFSACPKCKHSLLQKSLGIKAIEVELGRLFPEAKIVRFDSDSKKSESFSEQYKNIREGRIDIIIGTQLITKGLDLPLLETVGILQADGALNLPDFTSEERSFQQLTQVSGRVGRGHSKGHVIIQTYQPSNKLFDYVRNQDWHGFYKNELINREQAGYPPFSFAMKLRSIKNSQKSAITSITNLKNDIKSFNGKILGPAPSFYEKINRKYSWQIILLSPSRKSLVDIAKTLPRDIFYDLDPTSLL